MQTVKYTNLLLLHAIESSEGTLALKKTAPLPRVATGPEGELPQFEQVINRLKAMSCLDPVTYRLPQRGRIELSVRGEAYDVDVVFHDTADDSTCEIIITKG